MKPKAQLSAICAELQSLQRRRAVVIKSRIMQANRLQAVIAGTIGYHSGMTEKDRQKKMVEASKLIRDVSDGSADSPMKDIILVTLIGIDAFNTLQKQIEKEMFPLAKELPVANGKQSWINREQQKGFGVPLLSVVIGETGDLANYSNPGKVWRRLGCAPWTFDGKTLMGKTWRSGKYGKLPASEWEAFGYSPRRRSIAYLIGECLLKNNKSAYRKRYDETKAAVKAKHPDYSDGRCHNHGLLLMTKLLLKNLWLEWNPQLADPKMDIKRAKAGRNRALQTV